MKAIIFDFWGTLVENGTYSPLRQTYAFLRVKDEFGKFVEKFEKLVMTKTYDDQRDAFIHACEEFGIDPIPDLIDKLIGVWNKNKILARPYPETLEVIQKLKEKGIKTAILSNTNQHSVSDVIDKFKMTPLFDVIHLSCQTGLLKQDPASFEKVLKELGVAKEDAIMVGDSLDTDVEGAKKAGLKAYLLDRHNKREYTDKIKSLTELLSL